MIQYGNFKADLILHSVNPVGDEAITFTHTHERFIHAEFMTHRVSRNASSSRAIPWHKMRDWTLNNLAMPLHYGSNKSGMQSGPEIVAPEKARNIIVSLCETVAEECDFLHESGNLHKEIVNRYIEPWGWINVISTWSRPALMNFFALRMTPEAHPNMQRLAVNMARLYRASIPNRLEPGDWHLPFVGTVPVATCEEDIRAALVWSVARCAWISYQTADGKEATFEDAERRHNACVSLKHVTPCEHQLRARDDHGRNGGTVPGFDQYRHMIPEESCPEVDLDALLDGPYRDRDFVTPDMVESK